MENPTENGIYPCTVLSDQGPASHCCMWVKHIGVWYWWIDDGLSGGWESVTDYNCMVVAWELPMQHSDTCSKAVSDVVKERERQKSAEGWTPAHDDEHADGSLANAAACYALTDPNIEQHYEEKDGLIQVTKPAPLHWPRSWHRSWWKPKNRRRNLVRAGALILAEIERLDRADKAREEMK